MRGTQKGTRGTALFIFNIHIGHGFAVNSRHRPV